MSKSMRERAENLVYHYKRIWDIHHDPSGNLTRLSTDYTEAFAKQIRLDAIAECAEIISKTRHRDTACKKLLALAVKESENE